MAKQVITTLVDDIDGTVAEGTIEFSWQGRSYEIDLSERNFDEFAAAINPFLKNARPVRRSTSLPVRGVAAAEKAQQKVHLQQVRTWAAANGIKVNERGRISAHILRQFEERHNTPVKPAAKKKVSA